MLIKASRFYGIGLTLVTIGAIAACSSDSGDLPTGGAGTNTGTSGSLGTAGTTVTGTGGTGTGTAGTGTGTAGTAVGTAGTSAGGSGGAASNACKGTLPASSLVTSFEDAMVDATTGDYKFMLGIPGGTYTYPKANFMVDVTAKSLHVKGTVKDYSGFGIYFNDCTNATMAGATGVSFNVKGNVGTTAMLSFRIQTNADTKAANGKGLCPATATYEECHAASFSIPVTAGGADVAVTWDKLMGGLPVATVDGKDITGLEWAFDWAAGMYDADVTVDDIKFTGTVMGGGGTGAGGTSSGGSGGSGGAAAGSGGSGGAAAGTAGTGGTQ